MDKRSRFILSPRLYGREHEVGSLAQAYTRIEQRGAVEAVMVRGYSGIGKSSIINEVHKGMTHHESGDKKGYFITWKFDQLCKSTASVVQAFDDLIEQLLSEGQETVNMWAERIREAVGANGQLLVELLPELQVVIGPQAPVAELGPGEAQNRFNRTFQQFVRVFCAAPHEPLVMFVDDLQWADVASLKLLELIASDAELHNFMLIGAYRDNEVDATHPLCATLRQLAGNGVRITDIQVEPLGREHVMALVEDTLRCGRERASGMAGLLEEKTSGNPFFINQLLRSFHSEGLLHFTFTGTFTSPQSLLVLSSDQASDATEAQPRRHDDEGMEGGRWEWDHEHLRRAVAVTENVVDLMVQQIQRLSQPSQRVLQLAAAVGDKFSLDTLVIVSEKTPAEVHEQLWEPLQAGSVLQSTRSSGGINSPALPRLEPLDATDDCIAADARLEPGGSSLQLQRIYKFLHDRVQQAAYSLIPEDQRPAMHLHIGRRLLAHTGGDEAKIDEELYVIVNQINIGVDLIITDTDTTNGADASRAAERGQLARLNFAAGKKARASMAYQAAVKYLDTALRLLGAAGDDEDADNTEDGAKAAACWSTEKRALTMEVFLEATMAQFLNTDYAMAERLCTIMLRHAVTPLERVAVAELQMQFHIQQHQMRPALDIGLAALEMLGVELVVDRPTLQLSDEEYCEGLPEMKDKAMLAAMRILMNLCAPTYVLEVPPPLSCVLCGVACRDFRTRIDSFSRLEFMATKSRR
jgi:predicted ATPase